VAPRAGGIRCGGSGRDQGETQFELSSSHVRASFLPSAMKRLQGDGFESPREVRTRQRLLWMRSEE
jgi:hypothetical protein